MQELRDEAQSILKDAWGSGVSLSEAEVLREIEGVPLVARFATNGGGADAPTVIAKRARSVAISDAAPWAFFDEWASLELLSDIDGPAIAPRLIGGDAEALVMLIEDLGPGPNLADALLGPDRTTAIDALEDFAACVGELHAATAHRAERFEVIRRRFAPSREHWVRVDRAIAATRALSDEIGLTWADEVAEEMDALLARLNTPGPFFALTHGDPCPDNAVRASPSMRLIDFEGSRFRQCMIDAVYWWVPFPSCWCANALPREMSVRLDAIYREKLSASIPEVADDDSFARAQLDAWAAWILDHSQWAWKLVKDEDQPWGIATYRQRFFPRWESFIEAASARGYFPALARLGTKVVERVRKMWPGTESLPIYPALR